MERTTENYDYLTIAKHVMEEEAAAILNLSTRLNNHFCAVVDLILRRDGKVCICGTGKSGIVAQKIAATLRSTGTPSVFLHPTDALHGDLGLIQPKDVIILISKSGRTDELLRVIPFFKQQHVPVVGMLGDHASPLASQVDIVIDIFVEKEADFFNAVPTCSSAAVLAVGDALALALMHAQEVSAQKLALYHPAGYTARAHS